MCKIIKNDKIYSFVEKRLCLISPEDAYDNKETYRLLLCALVTSRLNGLYNFSITDIKRQIIQDKPLELIQIEDEGKGVLIGLQTKNFFIEGILYDRFRVEYVCRNLFCSEQNIKLNIAQKDLSCFSSDKEIQILSCGERKTIEMLGDTLIKTSFIGKCNLEFLDKSIVDNICNKVNITDYSEEGVEINIYIDNVLFKCRLTIDNINPEDYLYYYQIISNHLKTTA